MTDFITQNKDNIIKILITLLCFFIVLLFFKYLFVYVAPFVVGYIIASLLNPFVTFLQQRCRVPRWLGALFSICICFFLIFYVMTMFINRLVLEAQILLENKEYFIVEIQNIVAMIQNIPNYFIFEVPDEIKAAIDTILASLLSSITAYFGSGVRKSSVNIVSTIPGIVMFLFVTVLSSFFMVKDKKNITAFIKRQMPSKITRHFNNVKGSLLNALAGYFKAQLILMSFTATICVIGYTIIGIPYGILLGIVTAAIDALPFFGSGFILWPMALYNLMTGNYRYTIGAGVIYLVVLCTRQIMEPKVLGSQIGVSPLVTLFSMYVGLKTIGVAGLIIGPIIMVILKSLQESGVLPQWK